MTLQPVPLSHPNRIASARCGRCNRVLTDPESIQLGIGPECRKHEHGFVDASLCKRDEFHDQFDNAIPFERALVLRRGFHPLFQDDPERVGGVVTNVPHLVVHHSPNGYEFGYGGSGPADLALNACQLYLNMTGYEGTTTKCYDGTCWTLAFALHQKFKSQFISSAPRTGRIIPFVEIDEWFKAHMTRDLLNQCAIPSKE